MPNETELHQTARGEPREKERPADLGRLDHSDSAAVIALDIAIERAMNEGPTITIAFKASRRRRGGQDDIKYKDVMIGQVTTVQLSEDHTGDLIQAKISTRGCAVGGGHEILDPFPGRVSLRWYLGARGRLLSGNYIGMQVGKSTTRRRSFTGLDVAAN